MKGEMMNYQGETVLVCGASGGIGLSVATEAFRRGAEVILHVHEKPDEAKILLENNAGRGMVVIADFSDISSIDRMFAAIGKRYPAIDVLINTVGIEKSATDQLDTKEWQQTFQVNLFAAAEITRRALGVLSVNGAIVHVASIAGVQGVVIESSLAYSLTKVALRKLCENLSVMHAGKARFISVSPGYTDTPIWSPFTEEQKRECAAVMPLKRFIKPEEVATFILDLTANDTVTGGDFVFDGGLRIKSII